MKGDIVDSLWALFGTFLVGYGVLAAKRETIRAGFRGYTKELRGVAARRLGITYAMVGCTIALEGLIAWIGTSANSRLLLAILTALAVVVLAIGNVVGLIISRRQSRAQARYDSG